MTRKLGLILALAMYSAAVAAPPAKSVPLKVEGDLVMVVRKFPVTITAVAGVGEMVYIWNYPVGVKADVPAAAFSNSNVLRIESAPKGESKITVSSLARGTFAIDNGETTIVVGDVPKPPGPDPDPDVPLSPLAKEMKEAAGGDATNLKLLAEFWSEAMPYLDIEANNTRKIIRDKMHAALKKIMPDDAVSKVRKIIAREESGVLAIDEDTVFTVDQRTVYRAFFNRIIAALKEATK